jgi:HPr kinase/phosphorylase
VSAAETRIHGTLVEVAGVGVLLLGRSGIGKSECAVELVRRGHKLVADDVVTLEVDADGAVFGESPELVRHYVELRGIGIVHIPSLFDRDCVADRARLELVVRLEAWGEGHEVERVGLARPTIVLADRELPCVVLPVAPGRNVATLVEVATLNHKLQVGGRDSVGDLDERVTASLRRDKP